MDKPLKLEQAQVIAKNYSERIIPLEVNILEALGITRALKETIQEDLDAVANIELLRTTLSEIESTLNNAGIEASNVRVPELSDFISQLANQVIELHSQISEAETQLEALI